MLDDDEFELVGRLLADAADRDGSRPLSDHLWLDLVARSGPGFAAVLAFDEPNRLGRLRPARPRPTTSTAIELVIAPDDRAATSVAGAAAAPSRARSGRRRRWRHGPLVGLSIPTTLADAIAAERRPGARHGACCRCVGRCRSTSTTSVDDPGVRASARDEAWLQVNNAAFHDHAEQGGWTLDTLRQREAEPWFDPDGSGCTSATAGWRRSAGPRCTPTPHPPMGEIYVIAVDPDFHGLGLGRALTLAGLDHLADRGMTDGMLYVDADNTAARRALRAARLHDPPRRPRLRWRHTWHHTSAEHDHEPSAVMNARPRHSPAGASPTCTSRSTSRSFVDAMEQVGADVDAPRGAVRRARHPRAASHEPSPTPTAQAADAVIAPSTTTELRTDELAAYVYATVSTDSFDETAQALVSELDVVDAQQRPLLARLADWVSSLGVDALADGQHRGGRAPRSAAPPRRTRRAPDERGRGRPLRRAAHHRVVGVGAAARATSPRSSPPSVELPDGTADACRWPPSAAWPPTPTRRCARPRTTPRCAAWPTVAVTCAAAMNAIKGEANIVNRRRDWDSPLDASLFANSVSRADVRRDASGGRRRRCPTSAAGCAPRRGCTATPGALPWWDLFAPLPVRAERDLVGRRARHRPRRVRVVQPDARRPRRPRARRAVDRRRAPRRQARRRVLHAVRRRPLAGAAQLERQRRLGADHRARARATPTTTPQLAASHAAAASTADGAGRDRQHLLRDAGGRGRACSTSTGADRLALLDVDLLGLDAGGRRHPQPVPVRDRGVRPPPAPHARRRRSSTR